MSRRSLLPLAIFVVCSLAYVALLGERITQPTPNNHYVYLAESFLHGQLSLVGNRPPGTNDWALYNGTWFVSFPPFPALVILPAVAIWGRATLDALYWAILAGVAPALLFVLLRKLSEQHDSGRSERENLLLTGLFAFGSVYFYVAVQGTVWFAAHVVASTLLMLFLLCTLNAAHPLLAGIVLGACALTRPPTLLMSLLFAYEAVRTYRKNDATLRADAHPLVRVVQWIAGTDFKRALPKVLLCAAPVALCLGLQFWMNAARWDDPFVAGHEYLQVGWRTRIATWGLFNYHFLPKNLAVWSAGLPWLLDSAPHVKISLHGLALWFTTPAFFWLLWPERLDALTIGLYAAALPIIVMNLMYQNSGWVQFGYRFSLDYAPLLFALLALGRRRFGPVFMVCALFALTVNTFGAITFDRAWQYYDNDGTQNRLFQPD